MPEDLPRGLQLSPDGKRAYLTNFGDGTLSVVDAITKLGRDDRRRARLTPKRWRSSPDGERILCGRLLVPVPSQ